jgi:predicted RNase H-like HicB family nuclease
MILKLNLRAIVKKKYTIMQTFTTILERAEEGGYLCWIEEIPEAMSQGETEEEAINNVKSALRLLLEVNKEFVGS